MFGLKAALLAWSLLDSAGADANPEVKSISFLEDWTEGQQGPALQSRTKDGLTVHLASWTSRELVTSTKASWHSKTDGAKVHGLQWVSETHI